MDKTIFQGKKTIIQGKKTIIMLLALMMTVCLICAIGVNFRKKSFAESNSISVLSVSSDVLGPLSQQTLKITFDKSNLIPVALSTDLRTTYMDYITINNLDMIAFGAGYDVVIEKRNDSILLNANQYGGGLNSCGIGTFVNIKKGMSIDGYILDKDYEIIFTATGWHLVSEFSIQSLQSSPTLVVTFNKTDLNEVSTLNPDGVALKNQLLSYIKINNLDMNAFANPYEVGITKSCDSISIYANQYGGVLNTEGSVITFVKGMKIDHYSLDKDYVFTLIGGIWQVPKDPVYDAGISAVFMSSYFIVDVELPENVLGKKSAVFKSSLDAYILVDGVNVSGIGGHAFTDGNYVDCNNPNGFAFYGINNPLNVTFKRGMPISEHHLLKQDYTFIFRNGLYVELVVGDYEVEITKVSLSSNGELLVSFNNTFASSIISEGFLTDYIKINGKKATGLIGSQFTVNENENGFLLSNFNVNKIEYVEFKAGMPFVNTSKKLMRGYRFELEKENFKQYSVIASNVEILNDKLFININKEFPKANNNSILTSIKINGNAVNNEAIANQFDVNSKGFAISGIVNIAGIQSVTIEKGMKIAGTDEMIMRTYHYEKCADGIFREFSVEIVDVRHNEYFYVDLSEIFEMKTIKDGDLASFMNVDRVPAIRVGGNLFSESNNESGFFFWGINNALYNYVEFKKGMPIYEGICLKEDYRFVKTASGWEVFDITTVSIEINEDNTKLYLYDTLQLTTTVVSSKIGELPTVSELIYTTSNADIATVSENGLITAKACGIVTIYITSIDGTATSIILSIENVVTDYTKPETVSIYLSNEHNLPTTIQLTTKEGIINSTITYSGIFNKDIAGTYTLTGTILNIIDEVHYDFVSGLSNTFTVDIIVKPLNQAVSYLKPQNKTVEFNSDHGLPTTMDVTMLEGEIITGLITYTGTYIKNIAGVYTLTGTITLAEGKEFADSISNQFSVDVTVLAKNVAISYVVPTDKTVDFNNDHGLPTTIQVTMLEGEIITGLITYTGTYIKNIAGVYTLTGTITLSDDKEFGEDISNVFTVKITVSEKQAVGTEGCAAMKASNALLMLIISSLLTVAILFKKKI